MKGCFSLAQNIEIEFKNLLTEEEFTRMQNVLNMEPSSFVKQVNHYFDTKSFSLKEKGSALRIRCKEDKFELTLKEPHSEGLLETNQNISSAEAKNMLEHNVVIDGPVKKKLIELRVPASELIHFGSLTTQRAEKEYKGGLIVLDYSSYLNQSDYEVEYEVDDYHSGKIIFQNLLKEHNISIKPTENKIRRLYEAMLKG